MPPHHTHAPRRAAPRTDAYVIRTEHYSEDLAGLWDWLCVPDEQRPASEKVVHSSNYGRKKDTVLSAAGRELLLAHLQVCVLAYARHMTRHTLRSCVTRGHSSITAAARRRTTARPSTMHAGPALRGWPRLCALIGVVRPAQTEYHVKQTVEALADSAYLRDPVTRWARTNADASPEEMSCLTACGTLPRTSKHSSSSSSAAAVASSDDHGASVAVVVEEAAMASSEAETCNAKLAVALEAASVARGGASANVLIGVACVLLVGYAMLLLGRRQGRRQARQELHGGVGDEHSPPDHQLSSGMAGYDLGVNDAALHGIRRQGAQRISSQVL